ncbi:MAG TPA: hypothetical protein VFY60_09410, partial [Pyrinomonadaceae bacterium]|nr:hypothetical protein [Pyrinomonadaceae bacterium]
MSFRVNPWLIFFFAFLCACDRPRPADTPAPTPTISADRTYDFTPLDKILERISPKHGGIALVL